MKAVVFEGSRQCQVAAHQVVCCRARPGVIVTHHGRLDDAPRFFRLFDERAEGVIKCVLRP